MSDNQVKKNSASLTLASGKSLTILTKFSYAVPGTYVVTAMIDPDQQILEQNESNNQAFLSLKMS